MVKLIDTARFMLDRNRPKVEEVSPEVTAPAKVKREPFKESIKTIIDENPGIGSGRFTKLYNEARGLPSKNDASPILLKASTDGLIKRLKQDGFWRYYPANYLTADMIHDQHATPQTGAKDYTIACKTCGKSFANAALHAGHIRWQHPKPKTVEPTVAVNPIPAMPEPVLTSMWLTKGQDDAKPLADRIEQAAKDYVWETGAPSQDIRDFINYVRNQ